MRKLTADKIFDGYRFLDNVVLVIDSEGVVENILPLKAAGDGVEFFEGIITPGFINCHCHLELSHTKGLIPEQTGLVDFVYKVVTERHFAEEEIMQSIAQAEAEMIRNGIVAVGDICNNTHTLLQKQKSNLRYYNFVEASGWLPGVSSERLERAKLVYEAFANGQKSGVQSSKSDTDALGESLKPRLQIPDTNHQTPSRSFGTKHPSSAEAMEGRQTLNSIVPHAPYSVSENLWQLMQPFFSGKVVSIHNQETRFEDEFFLAGTGEFTRMYRLMHIDNSHHQPTKKTSLQSYFHWLANAANIILVHNTFINEEDVMFIKRQRENPNNRISDFKLPTPNLSAEASAKEGPRPQTFFCLCVNANQYIENALPPIEMLRKNNCTVVLGTDSLASNSSLNILDEIKTIQQNFPAIPLQELLQWATIYGARALQMDDVLGSFEKGKKPGVVLIDEVNLSAKNVLA